MYSVGVYGEMIGDSIRMRAYVQALRDAVKPGSVVLDIGTGTGIFAMLASQFGAQRVYAIEPDNASSLRATSPRPAAAPIASSSSRACRPRQRCPSAPT
jgi:predicted RNA methylase